MEGEGGATASRALRALRGLSSSSPPPGCPAPWARLRLQQSTGANSDVRFPRRLLPVQRAAFEGGKETRSPPRSPHSTGAGGRVRRAPCKDRTNTVFPNSHRPGLQFRAKLTGVGWVEGSRWGLGLAAKAEAQSARGPICLLFGRVFTPPPAAREHLSGTSIYHLPLGTRTGKFPFSVWGVKNKSDQAHARISTLRSFYQTPGGRGWEGRL